MRAHRHPVQSGSTGTHSLLAETSQFICLVWVQWEKYWWIKALFAGRSEHRQWLEFNFWPLKLTTRWIRPEKASTVAVAQGALLTQPAFPPLFRNGKRNVKCVCHTFQAIDFALGPFLWECQNTLQSEVWRLIHLITMRWGACVLFFFSKPHEKGFGM